MSRACLRRAAACGAVVLAASTPAVPAEDAASPACSVAAFTGPTVKIAPNPGYRASGVYSLLFGKEYRSLWTTPLEVEVLDLQTFAGGLKPKEKGGGKQTRSLKFDGKDGRRYRFRSTDKEINDEVLPAGLKQGFARSILQDQNSSQHPAAALMTAALAEAAGLPFVKPRLVVLPDDPALGEFRKEFAGMLGTLEETPRTDPVTPGFEGVVQILDWEDLQPRLDASPKDRIDARAFLKSRLFDMLIGDWDRHFKQWDFAQKGGDSPWIPIPKDRDQAFAKYDGLMLNLARQSVDLGAGRLANFSTEYPPSIGLMWNSRDLDRRLLAGLELPVWNEVVAELQSQLGDAALERAACALPPEHYALGGPRLVATLKVRREKLGQIARDFYRNVSRKVDVFATAAPELAEIERLPSGELEIKLATLSDPSRPYFSRRFTPSDTDEVRVYLSDGNDRVVTRGAFSGGPKLRVIGGAGTDVFDENVSGGTYFYDEPGGQDQVVGGSGARVDQRPYTEKRNKYGDRPQDWGRSRLIYPTVDVETDIGLILGAAVRIQEYGFRADPYRWRQTLSAETATGDGWRFGYDGEWHRTNSRNYGQVVARYSEIEALRFYGFGNEVPQVGSSLYHHVDQRQVLLAPVYVFKYQPTTFSVGPIAKFSNTDLGPEHFIGSLRPYGSGDFGQVGAQAGVDVDTREPRLAARKGVRLRAGGAFYPAVWSVKENFGEAHADASLHVPIPAPLKPSLGFRVGAKRLFGLYPFHEAAYLGGMQTVRGISRNRFAGDSYAFGNAELRLRLHRNVGILGLADVGRVYLKNEESDQWHTSAGGGLWLAFRDDKFVVSVTSAKSEGHVSYYLKSGLAF
jgi:hypothetical protein